LLRKPNSFGSPTRLPPRGRPLGADFLERSEIAGAIPLKPAETGTLWVKFRWHPQTTPVTRQITNQYRRNAQTRRSPIPRRWGGT